MDCFETVLYQYYKKTQEHLFPKGIKAKDKFKIYFINFTHIIGTLYILFGIFTPSKYLPLYITFLITVILLYLILGDKCFMNDILDKNLDKKVQITAGSRSINCVDSKITHLKMRTIYLIILTLLVISIIGIIDKRFSLNNIIIYLINKIKNLPIYFHITPLIILYSWIIGYFTFFNSKNTK